MSDERLCREERVHKQRSARFAHRGPYPWGQKAPAR